MAGLDYNSSWRNSRKTLWEGGIHPPYKRGLNPPASTAGLIEATLCFRYGSEGQAIIFKLFFSFFVIQICVFQM